MRSSGRRICAGTTRGYGSTPGEARNPAYNAYDVEYSYSNCPAFPFFNGVTFRGLATYDVDLGEIVVIANGLWDGEPSGQVFVLER